MKPVDLEKTLTIYGRNSVCEALDDNSLKITAVHLADTNKRAAVLDKIEAMASQRGIPISVKSRLELSRISRNKKQDQGVAADILLPKLGSLDSLQSDIDEHLANKRYPQYIALDGVTNPQNVGMIIRSVAASGIAGLVLPRKGCAAIGPLVIKASAGAVFKCPIFRCDSIREAVSRFANELEITTLDMDGERSFESLKKDSARMLILGSESSGVSSYVEERALNRVKIPMANEVESLNVAVAAALLAYKLSIYPP